jgi:hypothetical protein
MEQRHPRVVDWEHEPAVPDGAADPGMFRGFRSAVWQVCLETCSGNIYTERIVNIRRSETEAGMTSHAGSSRVPHVFLPFGLG